MEHILRLSRNMVKRNLMCKVCKQKGYIKDEMSEVVCLKKVDIMLFSGNLVFHCLAISNVLERFSWSRSASSGGLIEI